MKLKRFNDLNENINPNNDYFITDIDDIDITIKDYGDIEYDDVKVIDCNVYWDYNLILKKYGIDSIIPSIKKVNLIVDFITWDDDDEDKSNIEDFEFDIMNSNIETDNDGIIEIPYYPTEIEIDSLNLDKNPNIKIIF